MSAQLKFKKTALYLSVNSISQWKHITYLCMSVLLSTVSSQSFAVPVQQTAQIQEVSALTPQQHTEAQSIAESHLNPAQDAALASSGQKLSVEQDKNTVPDSMLLLQQQLQQQQPTEDFQDINLQELDDLPALSLSESMTNEIYAVADEAKKEALNYRAHQKNPVVISRETQQELAEINLAPVNVDRLMSNIQAERNIVVHSDQKSVTPFKDIDLEEPTTEDGKQPGFFKRLANLVHPEQNTNTVQRIAVNVTLLNDGRSLTKQDVKALAILKHNIEAKLSSYSLEAFEDYSSAVPQLRSMSTEAAQAVGYYNAVFRFEHEANNKLKVLVEPGEPVLVEQQEITFSGEGANLAQFQVIALLPDLQEGNVLNQGLYTQTKQRIDDAASNFGFFDSYWRLHDLKVLQPQDEAEINLKFETGNRYKLGAVKFIMDDPNQPFPLDDDILQAMVPWKEGQAYALWRVNQLNNNLTNSRYFNYTFVDAVRPDPVIKPVELPDDVQALIAEDEDAAELQAQLTQKENMQSSKEVTQNVVNEDQFAGTGKQDDEMKVNSRIFAESGQDSAETEQLKQQARDEQSIPVIVTLNADKLNNVELGMGYGSDTGVRLRSQYRRAIVNRRGHSFDANMEVSQIRQSIDGRYNIPYKHPLNDYFALVGGYEREERKDVADTGNLQVEAAVAGLDRVIKNPRGGWQQVLSTRYRLDRLKMDGASQDDFKPENIPSWFLAGKSTQQQSLLWGYEIARMDANKAVNPTQGFSQSYKLEVGSQHLENDTDLAIANINWRFLWSFGENDNNQLIGRSSLGYIFAKDFEKVPYNLRYFAGGDQSIRGFDYKSLSPVEDGFKIGGQALAVGSLEYNYQFMQGWRAAIFSDFGNAYDQNFSNPTEYSIGLGMRWASPIGPVRVDVASGISSEDRPIRLHFIIGPQL